MGAGKSTVAKAFHSDAYIIHADGIQHDALQRASPFVKDRYKYSWRAIPDPKYIHLDRLLNASLMALYPDLDCNTKPIVIEACVLSLDWFREPLLAELRSICPQFKDASVEYFDLIPTKKVVRENISVRMQDRTDEEKYVQDENLLNDLLRDAKERTGGELARAPWTRYDDSDNLTTYISQLLDIPGNREQTHGIC